MKCASCHGTIDESARFCEFCGSPQSGSGLSLSRVAQAYRRELEGDLDGATEYYEKLLAEPDAEVGSSVVRKHLGNLHFRLGHLRRAKEHLSHACELDPTNGPLWHDLGVILYHMADLDGAVDAFSQALSQGQRLELSYFWLGNALYHRGDYELAADAFRSLIERYPSFTIARFHLGVIYARQGDKDRAREEFRRVLTSNPENAAARHYVSP